MAVHANCSAAVLRVSASAAAASPTIHPVGRDEKRPPTQRQSTSKLRTAMRHRSTHLWPGPQRPAQSASSRLRQSPFDPTHLLRSLSSRCHPESHPHRSQPPHGRLSGTRVVRRKLHLRIDAECLRRRHHESMRSCRPASARRVASRPARLTTEGARETCGVYSTAVSESLCHLYIQAAHWFTAPSCHPPLQI